jgi:hypothetical protein
MDLSNGIGYDPKGKSTSPISPRSSMTAAFDTFQSGSSPHRPSAPKCRCFVQWLASLAIAAGIAAAFGSVVRVMAAGPVRETFNGPKSGWLVGADVSGTGQIVQANLAGALVAQLSTASSGSRAQIRLAFADPAPGVQHIWGERPGTYRWQRARVFIPSATLAKLGAGEYVNIAGLWPSSPNTYGWFLRIRSNGAIAVVGNYGDDIANTRVEFNVKATVPRDTWFTLEIGLHSQNGPGVKRAFAFLINGNFYGWYRQGKMATETYDRAAIGILATNSPDALTMYVDDWGAQGTTKFPTGPDVRSTANVQEQNFRTSGGVMWQIDWATWSKDLRLDPLKGLYSNTDRMQGGRNVDRMPDLTSGWAEIEIDWPKGTPPTQPTGYFGPMVGFRKEINLEQNFEVIPFASGAPGQVDLLLEVWDGTGPVPLGTWPMPTASIGGTEIPEPGDIIRVRWEQVTPTNLAIRASYFDASTGLWHPNILGNTYNASNVGGVNFNDTFHKAPVITTDSPYYSIRRFKVGTLATYLEPN